jgi:CO/xanthine dehydrogenase FAD-binding subunit
VGAEHFVAAEAEEFLRGPVDYKRHLAGELTVRALRRAAARAGGRAA